MGIKNKKLSFIAAAQKNIKAKKQRGFTMAELLAALTVGALLIAIITSVTYTVASMNGRARVRAEVSAEAFEKVQDYVNLKFEDVPIGDGTNSYEVEDFSADLADKNLPNLEAKVYAEPESEVDSRTIRQDFTTTSVVDTSYADGPKINTTISGGSASWRNHTRINDNNYNNYTLKRHRGTQQYSPILDTGSNQLVSKIRIYWYCSVYGSPQFTIQSRNGSSGTFVDRTSNLSDNIPSGSCSYTRATFQDITLSSPSSDRYWRVNLKQHDHYYWAIIDEIELFAPSGSGDMARQIYPNQSPIFDSSIVVLGKESYNRIGLAFRDVGIEQGAEIDRAFVAFRPLNQSSFGSGPTVVRGVDTDSMGNGGSGPDAIINAIDSDNSDGMVGTTAISSEQYGWWINGVTTDNSRIDVASVVQELVDRPGWDAGNDMGLVFRDYGRYRRASISPAPQLVIEWHTEEQVDGGYVDNDGDGDADNPTLLKLTSVIEYDSSNGRQKVQYTTYMRRYGVGD